MSVSRPPLPPADYQRIVRVVKTVFDFAAPGTLDMGVFLNLAGARLVEQVVRKRCQPIAGAAFLRLGAGEEDTLSFCDSSQPELLSSKDGFHCWTLCEGFIVDFMAPFYREALQARAAAACERRMFQKPLTSMSDSRLQMRKPGDFFMLPNVALTRTIWDDYNGRDDVQDLLAVCQHWYRKPPEKIEKELLLQRGDGTQARLQLSTLMVNGVW